MELVAANNERLTQRDLDMLAVQVLTCAHEQSFVIDVDEIKAMRKPLGKRLKQLGPQVMEHVHPPGDRGYSLLSKRLVAYAQGLASHRHKVMRNTEQLRLQLQDPELISDQMTLACRVLDLPVAHNKQALPEHGLLWLGALGAQLEDLDERELLGPLDAAPTPAGLPSMYGGAARGQLMGELRDLVLLARGENRAGHAIALWQIAHDLHRLLDPPDMPSAGVLMPQRHPSMVRVTQLPNHRGPWRERNTTALFEFAMGLEEILQCADEQALIDELSNRCNIDGLVTGLSVRQIGMHIESPGQMQILLELAADMTPLLERYESSKPSLPQLPKSNDDIMRELGLSSDS